MPRQSPSLRGLRAVAAAVCASLLCLLTAIAPAYASPPPIRTTAANRVPACVTTDGLMAFLRTRNPAPAPKFEQIATHYREIGETLRIRWDYAFFQMLIETNYLKFRRGDGSPGDVNVSQNNFAGIGATGNGVPGDRFPDVRTGVLAQLQHLVAYSGERVPNPVAQRTRDKQDDIIFLSLKLGRPPGFADLARRWAVDPAYARSIETVADLFRRDHCTGRAPSIEAALTQPPAGRAQAHAESRLGAGTTTVAATAASTPLPPTAPKTTPVPACLLFTASFGGDLTRLIASRTGAQRRVTALTVSRAQADAQTEAFIKLHAPEGRILGSYDTLAAALAAGERVCPAG